MIEQKRKIAFPRYAEYNCAIKYVVEQGLGCTCILQAPLTRRTEELGAKHSPDSVCTPFKTTLGSMMEALESGADTIIMTYGACRLGYYGELQEQILRDLGYDFDFINLSEYNTGNKKDWIKVARRIQPKLKPAKFLKAFAEAFKMAEYLDEITALYYENCGFAEDRGVYKLAYRRFIGDLYASNTWEDIQTAYRQVRNSFQSFPLHKPLRPLRVGIVGEFYTAMDAFSNLEAEQKLADMGVEVHRWMNISNRMLHYPGEKNLNIKIRDLCDYEMGPTSTANIWCAKDYAERGFDGLVHVKSANCTPEIDIVPILQRIAEEHRIPLLILTYDSQSSDVGLMTRLEAFYDMIEGGKRTVR